MEDNLYQEFCKEERKWYRICNGEAYIDSTGLTRAYEHRTRGSYGVLLIWSLAINKPIMVIWHYVSVFINSALNGSKGCILIIKA